MMDGMVSESEFLKVSSRTKGTKDTDRFPNAAGTDAPFSSVMGGWPPVY